MPKMKSNSGAKKRFRTTASGLFRRGRQGKNHILTKKKRKRKRRLRLQTTVDPTNEKQIARLLPYA